MTWTQFESSFLRWHLARSREIGIMLDILDFVKEKGGDPQKVRESQQRRHVSEAVVDDILVLYEDHKKSRFLR